MKQLTPQAKAIHDDMIEDIVALRKALIRHYDEFTAEGLRKLEGEYMVFMENPQNFEAV